MSTIVDLSKGIVVLPLLSFYFFFFSFFSFYFIFSWPHWLFLFISHFSSFWDLFLSYLGSFVCPIWDLFLTLRATLYCTRSIEDLHTLQEVLNIKKMKTIMMYANVCLCQCSRICNDTSASCSNY